jgi:hypothetical protein
MTEPSQLDRIEAKLDLLIQALGEEEQEFEPGYDLNGNPAGMDRDESQEL